MQDTRIPYLTKK